MPLGHLPSSTLWGEVVLKAGTSPRSRRAAGSRLAAMMRAATPNAAQSRIFTSGESRRPRTSSVNGTLDLLQYGKSSIRRSAIARQSACAHRPPGNRAINEANLCVAVFFGSSDSSAASSQGSTYSRASVERTLSGISFPSAPIAGRPPAASPVFQSRKGGQHLTERAVNHMLKRTAATAGVTANLSAHWLRHAHASHAIDRGAALPVVQATLGHGNISVTSGYLHARPGSSSGLHLDPGVFLR